MYMYVLDSEDKRKLKKRLVNIKVGTTYSLSIIFLKFQFCIYLVSGKNY